MNKSFTNAAKGLFILLIVFSHTLNTIHYGGFLARPLGIFRDAMGQICVTPFFLITGFGLFEGYKIHGHEYNKKVLFKHLFEFYLVTFICLIPYFIIDCIKISGFRDVGFYLLSFIGLESLGNQSWFIFAILFTYLVTYLIGLLKPNKWLRFSLICVFVLIYYFIFAFVLKYSSHWYNTIIAFPLGALISNLKEKIESFVSTKKSVIGLIASLILYGVFVFVKISYVSEILLNVFFSIGFVFASNIFTSKGKIIGFIGASTWPLFMLHMIPINFFSTLNLNQNIFYLCSIVTALLLMVIFVFCKKFITNSIFRKKQHKEI